MFLPMLAGNYRGCTRTPSPPTGGTLFVVSQKERKVEVERGRQVDVSAHVGWGRDRGGDKENGREVYFMSYFSCRFQSLLVYEETL